MAAHLDAAASAFSDLIPDTAAHTRQTTFVEGVGWQWVDDPRRLKKPPMIPEILRDKLCEHGIPPVVEIVGLSRVTILSCASGTSGTPATWWYCGLRLPELARLDRIADARAEDERAASGAATPPRRAAR